MNSKEAYAAWAPANAPWSMWVSPVAFAAVDSLDTAASVVVVSGGQESTDLPLPGTAVVLDLPGPEAVRRSVELSRRGFQPVPILNAAPGPGPRFAGDTERRPIVDLSSVTRELLAGVPALATSQIAASAPPAFAIDGNRMSARPVSGELKRFDNRWIVYPADFPSGANLREHGISRVVVVQQRSTIAQDMKEVLLAWQNDGIEIFTRLNVERARDVKVILREPSTVGLLWRRLLRALGFKTNADFVDFLNSISSGGSGS